MVARALGIPLEELIFGGSGNGRKSDMRGKQYHGKSSERRVALYQRIT
jgi:hypothetical protein